MRVRLRLTLLYGGLFVLSGAILLGFTYLLVSNAPRTRMVLRFQGPPGADPPTGDVFESQMLEAATRQDQEMLHRLLVNSGIALALTALVAVALGWLVAGRILRPLRTMTGRIQQISARNVHERLASHGPADEVRELSDTVDGLLERLEAALGAQRRVVANAAHELRTPLTLERALLEETLMDPDADEQAFRAVFERLVELSRNQTRLLESLLTLAGSEQGPAEREPVDLTRATSRALLGLEPSVTRLGLRLTCELGPAGTLGHPALAERLVGNLVENAADYNTGPGGWIEVATVTRDGRAVLSVENSGPAVPAERVDGLFEPFQRLDRTAGAERHHGLGLSIVRAIAAAHDAVITADAGREGGLRVEVAFPAAPDH